MSKYDFLIVGAGLFGAVFAHEAKKKSKKCLVIDRRNHIGGNVYCENIEGINVHKYGAHIFHTSNKEVWNYVNNLVEFNRYTNAPVANYKGELYNLPFNMNTFYKLWGCITPAEVKEKLKEQTAKYANVEPENLEQQALKLIGEDVYEKLIKGYTEKQWGCAATELPAFIITRLPVRLTYDNNYFNDNYQGIPVGGYNILIEKLLDGVEIQLDTDFLKNRVELEGMADKVIYTGMLDEFFEYDLGQLNYRSVRFETQVLDTDNYQGNAVVNYTERDVPYTRIIEHKHFEFGTQARTVISREYSQDWDKQKEAFYPINNEFNNDLYSLYRSRFNGSDKYILGGRLADYKYYDMDKVVALALDAAKEHIK